MAQVRRDSGASVVTAWGTSRSVLNASARSSKTLRLLLRRDPRNHETQPPDQPNHADLAAGSSKIN